MTRPRPAFPTPPSSSARQIELLELVLDGIVELQPVAVEHLEAVVVGRVVRRRDHDPADEHAATGQEGEGRRGDDTDAVDIDPEAGRAGRDGGHEHVAGPAGVLADDQRSSIRAEVARGGPAEVEGEGRLEVDVGDPTDPVRPEQSWH